MTTPPPSFRRNIVHLITPLFGLTLLVGLGYVLKKINQLSSDITQLRNVTVAATAHPVECLTVHEKPTPEPPKAIIPPHIPYQLLTSDRTMYGIYLTRCHTRKGFEGFQADMVVLNQGPASPQKIADARALGKIKAGQIWWFPPYCTKLQTTDAAASTLAKK